VNIFNFKKFSGVIPRTPFQRGRGEGGKSRNRGKKSEWEDTEWDEESEGLRRKGWG
jgi:hypothetical protein